MKPTMTIRPDQDVRQLMAAVVIHALNDVLDRSWRLYNSRYRTKDEVYRSALDAMLFLTTDAPLYLEAAGLSGPLAEDPLRLLFEQPQKAKTLIDHYKSVHYSRRRPINGTDNRK